MRCPLPDGNFLFYEFTNQGTEKPVLVFINGLTQSTYSWALTIEPLKEKFSILQYDLIFQGQSSSSGKFRSFSQHAEDLHLLLSEIKVDKAMIAGLSYGGFVAQHFCSKFPEKVSKAFFMGTASYKSPHFRLIEETWWQALKLGGYKHLVDLILPFSLSNNYLENPKIPLETLKELRDANPMPNENVEQLMQATLKFEGFPSGSIKADEYPFSVWVMAGQYDVLFPPYVQEHMARLWKANLHIIPDKGHTLNLEATEEIVDLVIKSVEQG